jgi:hypothetical protein
MASISNATLTISHDHTKKTARPIVKAKINFSQYEMNQMKDGLKFKLKCQLWGADSGLIPNPADQNPWAQSRTPIDMMVQG